MYTFKVNTLVSMWPILSHFKEDIVNLATKIRKIRLPPKLTEPGVNELYAGINAGIHNQLALICIQELEAIIKCRAKTYILVKTFRTVFLYLHNLLKL